MLSTCLVLLSEFPWPVWSKPSVGFGCIHLIFQEPKKKGGRGKRNEGKAYNP